VALHKLDAPEGRRVPHREEGNGGTTVPSPVLGCLVLHAHVAVHNTGSVRVLEKCAFQRERDRAQEAKAPPSDDGIEELSFVLDA
jgi:hypothetical protein